MAEESDAYKRAIALALQDKSGGVYSAGTDAISLFQRIDETQLSGTDLHSVTEAAKRLNQTVEDFRATYPAAQQQTAERVASLKKARTIRRIVEAAVLAVCLFAFTRAWWLGILLFIVLMGTRHILKKKQEEKAQQVARESWRPVAAAQAVIGKPLNRNGGPTGLCATFDDCYLRSLDREDRRDEMHRREVQQQRWDEERRHRETLNMQQQQADLQRAMLHEAQEQTYIQSDIAYTKPSKRYNR